MKPKVLENNKLEVSILCTKYFDTWCPNNWSSKNELCNFLGALHPRHQLVFDIKVYGFCHAMLFRLSRYSCMSCKKKLQCTAFFEITPEAYNGEYEFTTSVCTWNPCFHGQFTRKVGAGLYSKLQAVLCTWKPTFFCLLSFEATDSFWNKVVSLQPNQPKRNQLSVKAIDSIRLLLSFMCK